MKFDLLQIWFLQIEKNNEKAENSKKSNDMKTLKSLLIFVKLLTWPLVVLLNWNRGTGGANKRGRMVGKITKSRKTGVAIKGVVVNVNSSYFVYKGAHICNLFCLLVVSNMAVEEGTNYRSYAYSIVKSNA